jgi:hypothetical protein
MIPSIPRPAEFGKFYLAILLSLLILAMPALAVATGFAPEGEGPTYPATSDGRQTAVPSLEALRIENGQVRLDGVLDDEVWDMAHTAFGFQQFEPGRGGPPSVPTTFKVAYDDEAIYFGLACWEQDTANIDSFLGRRDQIQASDIVSIYIDPYHDRTTGYNFRVNPAGVQEDSYLFDNGDRDKDWNGVWESAVSHDDHGWYVEVRVPFSVIRFQPREEMTWGLQVYRWLHGRGEDTSWVTYERNLSGFVSRWGTLTGLRGVQNPRKLEVLPYVVTKSTDPATSVCADDVWQNQQNFGADFKYGLTSNLTLNATFQPDFGQVEADPATLNLSPFETWFEEKRPFFVEGARYFQQPGFNMFYSRRIGTGDPNSRIRAAAKLTGKLGNGTSLAVLGAATDVGVPGKTHNPLVGGEQVTYFSLVRIGREFAEGNHFVNFLGTMVQREKDTFTHVTDSRKLRNGYSGGMDFQMNWRDRMYRLAGSFVGTHVVPFADFHDPSLLGEETYGTGGRMEFRKAGGKWRGEAEAGWEHDKLDPNDLGFLQAPDDRFVDFEASYHFNSDDFGGHFNNGHLELDFHRSWLYAGNTGRDLNSGDETWSYGPGHRQGTYLSASAWAQHSSYHQGHIYIGHDFEGTSKHATRNYEEVRGPLMTRLANTHISAGLSTDYRKSMSVGFDVNIDRGEDYRGVGLHGSLRWNQNQHLYHSLGLGLRNSRSESQWMDNFANDGSQPGVTGIGGVDHVFGRLEQTTFDLTLRSTVLFDRDRSLQLYLQPFLTYGDY